MSDIYYINSNQISESYSGYVHNFPKYGKSTTDPTYYEPAATRIANMKKASGVQLQGLYDFYSKDDVSKFNEENFRKNISNAQYDPRYNSSLLPEEISQVANNYADNTQDMINNKKLEEDKKNKRIQENIETANKIYESNNNKVN